MSSVVSSCRSSCCSLVLAHTHTRTLTWHRRCCGRCCCGCGLDWYGTAYQLPSRAAAAAAARRQLRQSSWRSIATQRRRRSPARRSSCTARWAPVRTGARSLEPYVSRHGSRVAWRAALCDHGPRTLDRQPLWPRGVRARPAQPRRLAALERHVGRGARRRPDALPRLTWPDIGQPHRPQYGA